MVDHRSNRHARIHLSVAVLLMTTTSWLDALCHMDASHLDSSAWDDLARNASFQSLPAKDAFTQIKTQTQELGGLIDSFKRGYVKNVFLETNYENHVMTYADMRIPFLLNETDRAFTGRNRPRHAFHQFQAEGNNSLLVDAHTVFQRVAIALELVTNDLRHYHELHEFQREKGAFFRLCKQTAERIVQKLHVLIMARTGQSSAEVRSSVETTLTRRIAKRVACVRDVGARNVRDWLILRSTEIIVHFYNRMFHLFERQEHYSN